MRALLQILTTHPDSVDEIVAADGCAPDLDFKGNVRTVTARQYARLSASTTPQGVMGIIALPSGWCSADMPERPGSRILLLEGIQNPGNVGTLIRTAAAFDFSGVSLSRECADPFAPKAVQASAGTVLNVWTRRTDTLLEHARNLQNNDYAIVATDTSGSAGRDCFNHRKIAIALGSEGTGLSARLRALADHTFCIPCNSTRAESLNVAAAGAICMFLSSPIPHV
jgi:RNA methyltransferase, TrmH family